MIFKKILLCLTENLFNLNSVDPDEMLHAAFHLGLHCKSSPPQTHCLDPDQDRHFVGPDLDPICCEMFSADNTGKKLRANVPLYQT